MRLLSGRNFTAADVRKVKDRIIEIEAYADGILVGGMSYPLEYEPKKPVRPKRGSHREVAHIREIKVTHGREENTAASRSRPIEFNLHSGQVAPEKIR
jgi:hypothetical protein